MPTKTKSLRRDRKLISSQPHEIAYAAKKVKGGAPAIRKAKSLLGRVTSRAKVIAVAKAL